jgi:hypothetical protein
MKSNELKAKSKEIQEKAEEAQKLEELLTIAEQAEDLVYELCEEIEEVSITEPHGWLSSIISDLRTEIENRLERL